MRSSADIKKKIEDFYEEVKPEVFLYEKVKLL